MRRRVWMAIVVVVSALLVGCTSVPDHTDAWLSYKYSYTCGLPYSVSNGDGFTYYPAPCQQDDYAPINYYANLGIAEPSPDPLFSPYNYTFSDWLAANGFPADGSTDAHAIYGNLADLQIGRDMHCLQNGQKIACYVANYGPPPVEDSWPDITNAVEEAVHGSGPFAVVAMVYDPTISGTANKVSFYAFGGDGTLVPKVALDKEGAKSVPRMCMACHGGNYDPNADTASGASFLPFDVFAFRFPKEAGYSLDDQQEGLRKLNALVLATNPPQAIQDLINGMYPGGATVAGSVAEDGYVPAGWTDYSTVYTGVVRPYCRMCHLAQPAPFTSAGDFAELADSVKNLVCTKHDMPHAQVPYGLSGTKIGFWNDRVAQQDLGNFLKAAGETGICLPTD